MTQKGFDLLKEKVPEFKNPLKAGGIIIMGFLIFLGIMLFFWWVDNLVSYGVLVSQVIVALICSAFSYSFVKNVEKYRNMYGNQAYRYYFFHFVILLLVTGNACLFHPLIVKGPGLLPFPLGIVLGIFFILVRFLLEWHIRMSGFDEIAHGLGIYMIFPEEGTRINTGVYTYIRHPMHLGDFCLALGFALLRNNVLALLAALISFIPFIVETRLEDTELVKRFGEKHKAYIGETGAFFPHKNMGKFLRLLFFVDREQW
ncbi:MAG: hypothetical protein HXS54_15485 [Theionarchaea archaeon]|nr:hypothetical protein [Theionarchaea archaeon]